MTIVAAAVRVNHCVCSMPAPARHHDVLRQINGLYDPEPRPDWTFEQETQGFITDAGVFLDRREAMQHVITCRQKMIRRVGPGHYQGDELYSEDLW